MFNLSLPNNNVQIYNVGITKFRKRISSSECLLNRIMMLFFMNLKNELDYVITSVVRNQNLERIFSERKC